MMNAIYVKNSTCRDVSPKRLYDSSHGYAMHFFPSFLAGITNEHILYTVVKKKVYRISFCNKVAKCPLIDQLPKLIIKGQK
jgi:hypothetical protein